MPKKTEIDINHVHEWKKAKSEVSWKNYIQIFHFRVCFGCKTKQCYNLTTRGK